MKHVVIAQWGGVAERVSSSWDEQRERDRAILDAERRMVRELRNAGRIKTIPMAQDGDYRRALVVLE